MSDFFSIKYIFRIFVISLLFPLVGNNLSAQRNLIERFETNKPVVKKDTIPTTHTEENISLLDTDNLPDYPADDLYKNIWTRDRLNPYQTPADSLPDTVYVDVSEFLFPVPGVVTSHYGPRWGRMHKGTDIDLETGDSVYAAFSGKVRIVDYEPRGYGHYVVVRHQNGLETIYAHLSQVLVVENQTLEAGEVLGLGGNTGNSRGSHLHFEFRYLGNAIDTEHVVNYSNKIILTDTLILTKDKMQGYQAEAKHGSSANSRAKYYVVRRGDTLSKIASRHGISIRQLAKLNKISVNAKIKAGKRLRVR
jgi:murein DD-endopeptidase MepM/ murein hydrolase activator NlpD